MENKKKTVFVAGGTGFIGKEVLKALKAENPEFQVLALARSAESQRLVSALGAEPVAGDLSIEGPWQKALEQANMAIFVAQPKLAEKVTAKSMKSSTAELQKMTEHFFAVMKPGDGKRIVYCSGHTWYGRTGKVPLDETMTREPVGFGNSIEGLVESLHQRISQGYDVVIGYPGSVYGNGSWTKLFTLDPLAQDKPLFKASGPSPLQSPIHVADVGRSLAFLLGVPADALAKSGRDFLLIDDLNQTSIEMTERLVKALGKSTKYNTVPRLFVRLFIGKILFDYMVSDFAYSNARIKSVGFKFRYPTAKEGIEALVKELAESGS